ncbi:MAG: zinc ribbon domain-containing protein [Nitrospinae bacterium]|nr:zinc ribbon domain-containing protein [Nitrospinota bacterium]
MPIYEYVCEKCRQKFEVTQKISDKPLTRHTEGKCGGKVKKLMSNNAFHLKGTGWYKTDYAKPKTGKEEKKAPASTESASTPAETKKETKKEVKAAAE